jgi:hypothetical protein
MLACCKEDSVIAIAPGLTPPSTLMHTLDRKKHTLSHLVIPSPCFLYLICGYDLGRVQPLE